MILVTSYTPKPRWTPPHLHSTLDAIQHLFYFIIALIVTLGMSIPVSAMPHILPTAPHKTQFITFPVMGTSMVPTYIAKSTTPEGIIGASTPPLKTQYQINQERPPTPEEIIDNILPSYPFDGKSGSDYMAKVNTATWQPDMEMDEHTAVKLQILLDWHHASPGPIDSTWGMNSSKAVRAFKKKQGLKVNNKMNAEVWQLLYRDEYKKRPALVTYTITKADVRTRFRRTPSGYAAKARDWELSYQNIYEMLGERFHMNVHFLKQLNKGKRFRAGQKITVVNVGKHNIDEVNRIVVDKRRNILYAYQDKKMVATYPTTIGNRTPRSGRSYSIIGKVFMPTYKADTAKKRYILPPGPNNPVGVAWMALSKPTFGIHGSPQPEGISRQRSMGCVRLTNWDASELYATIQHGTWVTFK